MKVAIAFLTKDRVELSKQSVEPLLQPDKFDLFWIDGSTSNEGIALPERYDTKRGTWTDLRVFGNVRGGAGAGIVFALTEMLKGDYDVVGLVENDVLLGPGWLDCLGLLDRGAADGLVVGAVSARCFEDRVLFQRSGYAVCHNLGAGMVLLTRDAALLVLTHFRTAWTVDNRRIFSSLAGHDIGTYWAFRIHEHMLTADWHWDAVLAAHGYASLALTPSPVEMIGQDPPLAEQGLKIVSEPVFREYATNFATYVHTLEGVREGLLKLGTEIQFHFDSNTGTWTYFPHQMHMLGGRYEGDWHLQEARGWGTFAWRAEIGGTSLYMVDGSVDSFNARLTVPVFGPCAVLVSGGKSGGQVEVIDEHSGYRAAPILTPEGDNGSVLQLQVPGGIAYRNIRITALSPGVVFYGLQTREKQPCVPSATFDYSNLPPV